MRCAVEDAASLPKICRHGPLASPDRWHDDVSSIRAADPFAALHELRRIPVAQAQRLIGLSLGADLCWPICYEELLRRLDLNLDLDGDQVTFDVERITIEPYDLKQPCRYDVVLDRLTHWYHTSREWIKKAVILDGLYVLNNPWTLQSMEKQTTYCAMMRVRHAGAGNLDAPSQRAYDGHEDLEPTLEPLRHASSICRQDR